MMQRKTTEVDHAHNARLYLEYGWTVVPIATSSKRPHCKWKHLTYPKARMFAPTWWNKWPHADIGVLTGQRSAGLVVLDVDGDEGRADELRDELDLPETRMATTPSGGRHLFFTSDTSVRSGTRVLRDLDVRGEGGLIVAPPARGRRWLPGTGDPAPLPEHVISRLNLRRPSRAQRRTTFDPSDVPGFVPGRGQRALARHVDEMANTSQGERNETLNYRTFCLSAYAATGELDPEEIRRAMIDAAEAAGLPTREAERTIESALAPALDGPAAA